MLTDKIVLNVQSKLCLTHCIIKKQRKLEPKKVSRV